MSHNSIEKKPRSDYPDLAAWFAVLDHTVCCQGPDGRCMDIHCVYCGKSIGAGWGPCSNGCTREVSA